MVYLLIVGLTILLIINFVLHDRCFCAPAVIFNASFLFSSIWAAACASIWDLNLHFNTVATIIGAVVFFSICTLLERNSYINNVQNDEIIIENQTIYRYKDILLVVFEVVVLYLYIKSVKDQTGIKTLSKAIYLLYRGKKTMNLPFYFRFLLSSMKMFGFWFSFQFAKQLVINRKIDIIFGLGAFFSAISTTFSGSRGDAILVLISLVIFIILLRYRLHNFGEGAKIKTIVRIIVLGCAILYLFPRMELLLGRKSHLSSFEYVSAYVGAEIKNLDTFIQKYEVPTNDGTWGSTTFYAIESTLGRLMGFDVIESHHLRQFQTSNGYFLGNVYTMLHAPLFDFGYGGLLVVLGVLAFGMQRLFQKSCSADITEAPLCILVYGYCASILCLSFFAWWFGKVLSTGFVYMIMSVWLLNLFYYRYRFVVGRN